MTSPQKSPVPSTSSTPTTAGLGITGDRKIPVSEAVSRECRVPEEARELGYSVITLYVDERIKKIEAHNSKVLEDVRKQTITLRGVTRGQGVVNSFW